MYLVRNQIVETIQDWKKKIQIHLIGNTRNYTRASGQFFLVVVFFLHSRCWSVFECWRENNEKNLCIKMIVISLMDTLFVAIHSYAYIALKVHLNWLRPIERRRNTRKLKTRIACEPNVIVGNRMRKIY